MASAPAASDNERELSVRAQEDLEFIAVALQGHAKGYEQLLQRYHKPVYHMMLKMVRHPDDAEDLTSEAFAKAFRYLSRYSPDFAFSTWLFRIANNNCIDFIRRKKIKTQSLDADLAVGDGEHVRLEAPDHAPNPHEALIRQQRMELIRQVVTRLPAKYAQLVHLRYFEELSYEEVAVQLQLPLGTVKAQLFRARELLSALLKDSKTAW